MQVHATSPHIWVAINRQFETHQPKEQQKKQKPMDGTLKMDVSLNGGTPKSSIFDRVFR